MGSPECIPLRLLGVELLYLVLADVCDAQLRRRGDGRCRVHLGDGDQGDLATGAAGAPASGLDGLLHLREIALQLIVSVHASATRRSPKRTQSSASAVKSSIRLRWLVIPTRRAYCPSSTVLETM